MLHIEGFLKYFIGTFLTLLLIINIIYAFDLIDNLGLPFVYQSDVNDYSDKYFGVNTLISAFEKFFTDNDDLDHTRDFMSRWYDSMKQLSLGNYISMYTANWGTSVSVEETLVSLVNVGKGIIVAIKYIGSILGYLVDLFVNLPYISMILIYFGIFLFYIFQCIFMFISFACYLFSGMAYSVLPNTYLIFI